MALTLPADTDAVLRLDELIGFLDTQIDVTDPAQLCSAAPLLRALANDRRFLADLIAAELVQPERFQNENSYFSRALILHRHEKYAIRAVIWLPDDAPESQPVDVSGDGTLRGLRNSIYGLAHSHAFGFLTVGYWGPGYITDIYECAEGAEELEVGAPTSLRFLERTTLPVGKVMYYRPYLDAHSQLPPSAMSISLNILVSTDEQTLRDQYDFDLATGQVADVIGRPNDSRAAVCAFAGALCGEAALAPLAQIAERHPSTRVRRAAAQASAQIAGRADAAR